MKTNKEERRGNLGSLPVKEFENRVDNQTTSGCPTVNTIGRGDTSERGFQKGSRDDTER